MDVPASICKKSFEILFVKLVLPNLKVSMNDNPASNFKGKMWKGTLS